MLTYTCSYGTFLFNNLVPVPIKALRPAQSTIDGAEAQGLLADAEADESTDATATLPAAVAAAGRTGFDVVPASGSRGLAGESSGGVEALKPSEERGFDVAGRRRSQ
jgi:hypothetical protein